MKDSQITYCGYCNRHKATTIKVKNRRPMCAECRERRGVK